MTQAILTTFYCTSIGWRLKGTEPWKPQMRLSSPLSIQSFFTRARTSRVPVFSLKGAFKARLRVAFEGLGPIGWAFLARTRVEALFGRLKGHPRKGLELAFRKALRTTARSYLEHIASIARLVGHEGPLSSPEAQRGSLEAKGFGR